MFKSANDINILETPLNILRYHQLWPKPEQSMKTPLFILKATAVLLFFCVTLEATISHMIYSIKNPHHLILLDFIEDIITFLVNVVVFYTIYAMLVHRAEIDEFLEDLGDFSKFGKPPRIDEMNKNANRFSHFFYFYGIVGSTGSCLLGLLEREECLKMDIHDTRDCGFLMPGRYPIKMDTENVDINFVIMLILEYLSLMFFLNSGVIIMAFIYGSCEVYTAKIIHLKEESLKLGSRPDLARGRIKYLVEYHVKIIKMCKTLNQCWGSLMLYHQLLVSIILSLIGVQFLLDPNIKPLIHAGGWLISLAIPCYAGQRLLDESSEIPMAFYSSEWYHLDNSSCKCLAFMIMSGNNYLYLDRDGYGPMNLAIVGDVVQNIYSVLTLLHGTMDEGVDEIQAHLQEL